MVIEFAFRNGNVVQLEVRYYTTISEVISNYCSEHGIDTKNVVAYRKLTQLEPNPSTTTDSQ